jgi:hypothetical protein
MHQHGGIIARRPQRRIGGNAERLREERRPTCKLVLVVVDRERAPKPALRDLLVYAALDSVLPGEKALSVGTIPFLLPPFFVPLDGGGILPRAEPLEPVA